VALGMMEEWLPQGQQQTSSRGANASAVLKYVPSWMDALLLILDQAVKVQHPPNTRPGEPKVPPPHPHASTPAIHSINKIFWDICV
jgi:hypothetical protein